MNRAPGTAATDGILHCTAFCSLDASDECSRFYEMLSKSNAVRTLNRMNCNLYSLTSETFNLSERCSLHYIYICDPVVQRPYAVVYAFLVSAFAYTCELLFCTAARLKLNAYLTPVWRIFAVCGKRYFVSE